MNLEAILTILITIAQIATVYLAARGNRWTWIFSIVTGLILCYNFFTDKHFMSFAFQVYSLLASIGGVFIWKKKEEDNRRTICWGNPLWPLLAVVGIAAATLFIDTRLLHSNLPVLDCHLPHGAQGHQRLALLPYLRRYLYSVGNHGRQLQVAGHQCLFSHHGHIRFHHFCKSLEGS